MKKLLFLGLLVLGHAAWANCPLLQTSLESFPEKQKIMAYTLCAENYNDEEFEQITVILNKNIEHVSIR